MKKYFLFIILLTSTNSALNAQNAGTALAGKIAQKMQDSLYLTDSVKQVIYTINIHLHEEKMRLRQVYTGKDSLNYYIQKTENTRDSLYHSVLKDDKYLLYKSKKRLLVNAN